MPASEPSPARNADYSNVSTAIADVSLNALSGTGSFAVERQFADVSLNVQSAPVYIDATGAVQIKIPIAQLNNQLTYQTATDNYAVDSVTISYEFISTITESNVLSVGRLSTLHSDFAGFMNTYFGVTGGFESLYAEEAFANDISNNTPFNKAAFVSLVTTPVAVNETTHAVTHALTGSVTVNNVSQLLRYIVDGDVFNNRDPADPKDWGLADKFQPGDLIWCPSGIAITLKLGLNPENMLPINTLTMASSSEGSAAPFATTAVGTTSLLTRVANAPILFILTA
jgi:hypothetical protein